MLPPIACVLISGWFIFWLYIFAMAASVGKLMPRKDLPFLTTIEWTEETRYVLVY